MKQLERDVASESRRTALRILKRETIMWEIAGRPAVDESAGQKC